VGYFQRCKTSNVWSTPYTSLVHVSAVWCHMDMIDITLQVDNNTVLPNLSCSNDMLLINMIIFHAGIGSKKKSSIFPSHRRYHDIVDDMQHGHTHSPLKGLRIDQDGDDVVYNTHDEFGEGNIGHLGIANNLKLVRTGRQVSELTDNYLLFNAHMFMQMEMLLAIVIGYFERFYH